MSCGRWSERAKQILTFGNWLSWLGLQVSIEHRFWYLKSSTSLCLLLSIQRDHSVKTQNEKHFSSMSCSSTLHLHSGLNPHTKSSKDSVPPCLCSSFTLASDFLPIDHHILPWIPISNKETHQTAEYANNCLFFPTECIDVTLKWCQKGLTTHFCRVCSCGINHQDKLTLLLLCSWTLIHLPYSSLPQWLRSDEANNKVPSGKWIAYMQFANTW